MLNAIKEAANLFIKKSENKSVCVVSHFDTDGITSASIISQALKRRDISFTVKILKGFDADYFKEVPPSEVLLILDLASNSFHILKDVNSDIFILDHHEISQDIPENITIINPHLFNEENISSSGISYLFARELGDNRDLAPLAVLGMIGDNMTEVTKLGNTIIEDAEVKIKKGILLYPATRPLNKTLEYSSIVIPGVTGDYGGTIELLREANIGITNGNYKSLVELDEDEMSRLITAIALRRNATHSNNIQDLVGNIYLIKFFNRLEDARELSALVNACSRLGNSHVALLFCMGNKEAIEQAEKIYAEYKQHLIAGLRYAESTEKIEGKEYVIINARDKIKDTLIGTIASILSSSSIYSEGTIIATMAYNEEKIKVSLRIAGKKGRNLRKIMESVSNKVECEFGGHEAAAGCVVKKEKEKEFLEALKKELEIELIKV